MKEHSSYKFLTFNQTISKLRSKNDQINQLKLDQLNLKRNYICHQNKSSTYKKLVTLIAQNRIPRIDTLLSNCIKKGFGINGTIDKINQAIQGFYKVKSFSQQEKDLGALVLSIGGPRLLHTFNKLNLLPNTSYMRQVLKSEYRLEYSYSKSIYAKISANMDRLLHDSPHIISLKMDEIILTPRFVIFFT